MAESYQPPPFSHPPSQQPQPGIASWYPPPPHPYQSQQQQQLQPPIPPQQHHNMQWPVPPPADQSFSYSQPYHSQGDYYPQQPPHQYPPPLQPAPPQFTYMYGPEDQVWQANSNWAYQQWPYPGQNASLTQEEVWAAKARAWAASKAAQNETNPVQPGPMAHQAYQEYFQQQDPPTVNTLEDQQYSLQPPGQEPAGAPTRENMTNQYPSKPSEQPVQGMNLDQTNLGFDKLEQKTMLAGVKAQSNDLQVVPSSHVQDVSPSYGLDDVTAAPPGAYRVDSISSQSPMHPSVSPRFAQQQPHLLPQSPTPPRVSQPQFNYTEQPSTSGYELHQQQQQQMPPNYQQQQQQQPPQPLQQSQYQPPTGMEGLEAEFGLSPASMQNWALAGGPGMPFPPAMGAGTSQFDHLHATHQIPLPMFGRSLAPQALGFPSSGPFVAGTGPSLVPGPGAPARPMFIPDGFGERPKKAAVPSWLREELMKKKAAGLAGNSTGMLLSDDSNRVNGGEPAIHLNPRLGISDRLRTSSPGLSDDEEDDEEAEVEAARNAAINQEIKRLLTEVLLKVTGDLFDEIAQEVLEEDDDEMFQGDLPLDEQDNTSNPPSPTSLTPAFSMPARVLVSSLKNHGANDDRDKDSGVSGSAAGDVLGLGEYASDEDDVGTKDHQMSVKVLETRREPRRKDFLENVSVKMDRDLDSSDQKGESKEIVGGGRGNDNDGQVLERPNDKEKYRDMDLNINTHSGKEVNDKDVDRGKKRYQEGEKKRSLERNTRSPEFAQEYHTDSQNGQGHLSGELDALISQSNLSIVKEEHRRGFVNSMKEHDNDPMKTGATQVGGQMPKESTLDKQQQDKQESKSDSKERPILTKELSSAASKISSRSVQKSSIKEMSNTKERQSLCIHKSADASGLEKKREERTKDSSRKKGTETVRNERSSGVREKDSSRDRRKEKVKEKEKPREREHERERRKSDKAKREREGRSKRRDASEKKTRHRSSSSSSWHTESRSSSSSSRDSRGRLHSWRSNRRHSSISSPGRSKKRRSASKSPVYRRRRS